MIKLRQIVLEYNNKPYKPLSCKQFVNLYNKYYNKSGLLYRGMTSVGQYGIFETPKQSRISFNSYVRNQSDSFYNWYMSNSMA